MDNQKINETPPPFDLVSQVLYRDGLMLVVNKPAGINVHKGPSGGISLEDYFDQLTYGLPNPPSLAHRLDRDTSGCLVLGRHRKALHTLGRLFSENKIKKTYWARVHGQMPAAEGRIDIGIKKIGKGGNWRIITAKDGQSAQSDYRVLACDGNTSFVELSPLTGRTHQLRIHCAYLGCPIVGDRVYGSPTPEIPLQLHARSITIPLYYKKPDIVVEAPPPENLQLPDAFALASPANPS